MPRLVDGPAPVRAGVEPDPEVVQDLQLQQYACEAALASTGRVVQPSIREFLR